MNLFDFYFRQIVTQSVMDWVFEQAELADHNQFADAALNGIMDGFDVTENATPDMTVNVSQGVGYTEEGARIFESEFSTNLDCSVDEYGVSTDVTVSGNERWLSIFARFKRTQQDPAIDGNGNQVYTRQYEDCELIVHQAAEDTIGAAFRPESLDDSLLLADINLVYGQSTIQTALHIFTDRRQDWINVSGDTLTDLIAGNSRDAMEELYNVVDDWATNGAPFSFTETWYGSVAVNGVTPPVTQMVQAINAIVFDLAKNTNVSGGQKIGIRGYTPPLANLSWPNTNVEGALRAITDFVDGYSGGTQQYQLQLANWQEMAEISPAPTSPMKKILYIPPVRQGDNTIKWGHVMLVGDSEAYWLGGDGTTINSCAAYPNGSLGFTGIANSKYYMVVRWDGSNPDIHYIEEADDAAWSTELATTIGGTASFIRLLMAKRTSDKLIAFRGSAGTVEVRIAPTGIGGGWIAATTPPSGPNWYEAYRQAGMHVTGNIWLAFSYQSPNLNHIWRTTDDGDTWSHVKDVGTWLGDSSLEIWDVDYNPNSGRIIAVGGRDYANGSCLIIYSDDDGATWDVVNTLTNTNTAHFDRLSFMYNVHYCGGNTWVGSGPIVSSELSQIAVSHDDGMNWTMVVPVNAEHTQLYAMGTDGKQWYAIGVSNKLLKSLCLISA